VESRSISGRILLGSRFMAVTLMLKASGQHRIRWFNGGVKHWLHTIISRLTILSMVAFNEPSSSSNAVQIASESRYALHDLDVLVAL